MGCRLDNQTRRFFVLFLQEIQMSYFPVLKIFFSIIEILFTRRVGVKKCMFYILLCILKGRFRDPVGVDPDPDPTLQK